jgi:general secretion pathway protein N
LRPRAIALVGAIGYAAFLVVTVPASWLAARISAASAGAVRLEDPQGTLWSGSASATLESAAGRFVLDRVQWRFAPAELAAGRIAFDVSAAAKGLDATLRAGRGVSEWVVGHAAATIDASIAATVLPLLAAWHPEGRVSLAADGLRWSNSGQASGTAHVTWDGAAVSLSTVKPLGRYAIDAAANNGPANVSVTTIEGPLRITGKGTFSSPSRFAFSGEARGEGPQAAALDPLLDLMGPRRADGSRAIEARSGP